MKILCFGDSNTWGHNPIDGSRLEKPWPRVLGELLKDCEIIEDGVCGRTTVYDIPDDNGKNGIESFKEYTENDNGAELLIIMLGTNDTLNFFDCSAKESADNIREYVRLWKGSFPNSEVLVVAPIHITNYAMRHPVFSGLYSHNSIINSHKFADEYEKAVKDMGVHFLDASLHAEPAQADGIHLAPEAHEYLAKAVCDKVKEIF